MRVVKPGVTAFTRMRRSFKSVVHVRANERTAAFVVYKHYLANNRSGGFYDTFLFTVQKALPLMQDGA